MPNAAITYQGCVAEHGVSLRIWQRCAQWVLNGMAASPTEGTRRHGR
jgi:hypothetical protein